MAAQAKLAEAAKMPEQPDWRQLAALGGAYPEFIAEVKKVYEAEAAIKRPTDDELLAAGESEFKKEVRLMGRERLQSGGETDGERARQQRGAAEAPTGKGPCHLCDLRVTFSSSCSPPYPSAPNDQVTDPKP